MSIQVATFVYTNEGADEKRGLEMIIIGSTDEGNAITIFDAMKNAVERIGTVTECSLTDPDDNWANIFVGNTEQIHKTGEFEIVDGQFVKEFPDRTVPRELARPWADNARFMFTVGSRATVFAESR
jgi:hypothetical protein